MKKALIIFAIIIIIFGISSCTEYEDLMPNYDDYAAWDGNYIYKGNYRSTTTGDNEQVLIDKIEYNNENYVIKSYTYIIYDKNIYFCFHAYIENNEENVVSTFIIKYNTYEKNYDILYVFIDKEITLYFHKLYNNYYYLSTSPYYGHNASVFIYNVNAKTMEIMSNTRVIDFFENDIFIIEDNLVKHSKCDEIVFTEVCSYYSNTVDITYNQESDLFLIQCKKKINDDLIYSSLGYYKRHTKTYVELVGIDEEKELQIVDKEYFIIYQTMRVEYFSNNLKTSFYTIKSHNKLCKVNLEDLTYEIIYEFKNKKADYTNGQIIDGFYYTTMKKVRKGFIFIRGAITRKSYKLNLEKMKLSFTFKKFNNESKNEIEAIKYNDLVYYFKFENFGGWGSDKRACYLYCKNETSNEIFLMQFFVKDDDVVRPDYQGVKSAFYMWNETTTMNDENTLILNY